MAIAVTKRTEAATSRKPRSWQWQAWPPRPGTLVATPAIYFMLVPFLFLDICTELYQRLVFPLLGIPRVPRQEYFRFDRSRLDYLDPIQKLGCAYCAYANGLLHLASRIAAETERYFCPIQHKPRGRFQSPPHHATFAPYGDQKTFLKLWHQSH